MLIRSTLAAVVALLSGGSALALTPDTLVVNGQGPSGYGSMQAAIDAAASGDVIVWIAPATPIGEYPGWTIDGKDLRIVNRSEEVPCFVDCTIRNVPRRSAVTVDGFDFLWVMFGNPTVTIESCDGPVRFEDCNIAGSPGVQVMNCKEVSFSECNLEGFGGTSSYALDVLASNVNCDRSQVIGAIGADGFWNGGIICENGDDGTNGARILGGSRLRLSRSELVGGFGGLAFVNCSFGANGTALTKDATSRVFYRETVSFTAMPSQISTTQPIEVNLPDFAMSEERIVVEVVGVPGDRVLLFSGAPARSRFLGKERGWGQVLASPQPPLAPFVPVGVIPANGVLQATTYVPAAGAEQVAVLGIQAMVHRPGIGLLMATVKTVPVLGDQAP